jgi:RNA polymerase sigma-70 factor (ECF subfamily)
VVVQQVLAGRPDQFRVLVERYQARLYGIAARLVHNPADAEDLVQQSFVEAYRALKRYDAQRRFVTWLMRITVNNCKDYLKSHKRRERQLDGDAGSGQALFAGRVDDPERALETKQRWEQVHRALGRLDPKYRIPLVLRDLEGLSYSEMLPIVDLPLTTLKIRVVRARTQLQEELAWMIDKN